MRPLSICVVPGDVALASAVRFLDLHHWVAEGWKRVSGAAAHRPWSEGINREALLKKRVTSGTM